MEIKDESPTWQQIWHIVEFNPDTGIPKPFTRFGYMGPINIRDENQVIQYIKDLEAVFNKIYGIIIQKIRVKSDLFELIVNQTDEFFIDTVHYLNAYMNIYPTVGRGAPTNKKLRELYYDFEDSIEQNREKIYRFIERTRKSLSAEYKRKHRTTEEILAQIEKYKEEQKNKNQHNKMENEYANDYYRAKLYSHRELSDIQIRNILAAFQGVGITSQSPSLFMELPVDERTPQKWRGLKLRQMVEYIKQLMDKPTDQLTKTEKILEATLKGVVAPNGKGGVTRESLGALMKIASVLYHNSAFKQRYEAIKPRLSRSQIIRNIETNNPQEAAYLKAELRGMQYEEIPEEDAISAIQHQYIKDDPNLKYIIRRPKKFKRIPGAKAIGNAVLMPLPERLMPPQGRLRDAIKPYTGTYSQYVAPAREATITHNRERIASRKAFKQMLKKNPDRILQEEEIPENMPIYNQNLRLGKENITALGPNRRVPVYESESAEREPELFEYEGY